LNRASRPRSTDAWSFGEGEVCWLVPVQVPPGVPGINAALIVGEDGAFGVDNPLLYQ